MSKKQKSQQDQDYEAAFNGGDEEAVSQTEDEVFGITPSEPEAAADETAGKDEKPADAGEAATETVAEAEPAAGADAAPAEDDAEGQRQRSWEGRLRAREEALRKREEELSGAKTDDQGKPPAEGDGEGDAAGAAKLDKAGDKAEKAGDTEQAAALHEAADDVAAGDQSFEEAVASLKADFGEEFTNYITTIATKAAKDALSANKPEASSDPRLDALIEELGTWRKNEHQETLKEAFPDLDTIASSEAFKAFTGTYENGAEIAATGNARQVIKMLKAFQESVVNDTDAKDAKPETPPAADPNERGPSKSMDEGVQAGIDAASEDAALDAAEGVRGGGSNEPKGARAGIESVSEGDYAAAWDAA